jgi:hypothetical protein
MRIGGGSGTGDAISHSRWPSWCAVLFEKSDTKEDVVSAGGLLAKPATRPVHVRFFMYQGYDIWKNRKANCIVVSSKNFDFQRPDSKLRSNVQYRTSTIIFCLASTTSKSMVNDGIIALLSQLFGK